MEDHLIDQEFKRIEEFLFDSSHWQSNLLTRQWAIFQPEAARVYMLFEGEAPVYVGESGSLSGRISDMLDSRHHTIRRAIGEKRFNLVPGYQKASSKRKHPEHIEFMVHELLSQLRLCVLPINIGRKEFEEYIFSKYKPEFNRKAKRSTKLASLKSGNV